MSFAERPPLPLAEMPTAALAAVVGVMTDIDDTLTRGGVIEPAALAALDALAAAGVPVVAVTGRSSGWSRPFAQAWPVAAIVAENGAVALLPGPDGVATAYAQDASTRAAHALRLRAAAARVLREVRGATLARDSQGRETDIAVDHGEFASLTPEVILQVVAVMQAEGLSATVSSIHVNGWLGEHSKWTGAAWMVRHLFGRDLRAEVGRWVYVGDSPNDQALFERFPLSVGVANLMRFAEVLSVWPAFITRSERGTGFAEVAGALLAARAG
jgi:HAD superfamily hydrolase (TIGR01484 family)